jgi:hypothetical protein
VLLTEISQSRSTLKFNVLERVREVIRRRWFFTNHSSFAQPIPLELLDIRGPSEHSAQLIPFTITNIGTSTSRTFLAESAASQQNWLRLLREGTKARNDAMERQRVRLSGFALSEFTDTKVLKVYKMLQINPRYLFAQPHSFNGEPISATTFSKDYIPFIFPNLSPSFFIIRL